jgi:hypothetical protein
MELPEAPSGVAVLQLRHDPRPARLVLQLYTALPGQRVEVALGGKPLCTWDIANEWRTYSVDVPAAAFAPSGLQELELRVSRFDENGLGVAMRTLDVVDLTAE